MRIAFVATECDPLLKVGGLADVVGSLPRALHRLGHDVEVYLPKFGALVPRHVGALESEGTVAVHQHSLPPQATIERVMSRGIPVHLVGCPELFEREPHPYGNYDDTPARYAFFALAALESMARTGWTPNAIHLHDWPTGWVSLYKSLRYGSTALRSTGTLFSIHNVAHRGSFAKSWLPQLGLPNSLAEWNEIAVDGWCSALKAGIQRSTLVGTVSPTYAREIQAAPLGCGMEGTLRYRGHDLVGILNGIDTEVWDPAKPITEPERSIYAPFSAADPRDKEINRSRLRAQLGLTDDPAAPIFGCIGRLDPQKGIPAIFAAMPRFLAAGCQLAVLGDGADVYRNAIQTLADKFPGRVAGALEFNAVLAERIYAASDFFLMPSKFEPCGLAQMIAARYGSIPIVARTGGLADTIVDADADPRGYGFVFSAPTTLDDNVWLPAASHGLADAVDRALRAFADRPRFEAIRRRAMEVDFGWEQSAKLYLDVYSEAARRERG